jgi:putative transposase
MTGWLSFRSLRSPQQANRTLTPPEHIESFPRCYGPEITSRHFLAWGVERRIDVVHIQPGKPTQNAQVESFNGRLRDECLNVSWFWNLLDARRKIARWGEDYNRERPHSALNYRTPEEFAQQWSASPSSVPSTAESGPASRQPCGLATLGLDPSPLPP